MRPDRIADYVMIGSLIVIVCALTIWAFTFPNGESDAMKVCELSHSHDVCFQALNR